MVLLVLGVAAAGAALASHGRAAGQAVTDLVLHGAAITRAPRQQPQLDLMAKAPALVAAGVVVRAVSAKLILTTLLLAKAVGEVTLLGPRVA